MRTPNRHTRCGRCVRACVRAGWLAVQVSLTLPAKTVAGWGGVGAEVEVRLSEQLSDDGGGPHSILWPGAPDPFDPGNWNKVPKWSSVFTLSAAEGGASNHFEPHEYIGPWRYGEIHVRCVGRCAPESVVLTGIESALCPI